MSLPIISIAQMRDWEQATWSAGGKESEVIRRVGLAVAAWAMTMTRAGDCVLILAGKGNNGQDARLAIDPMELRRVELVEVPEPAAAIARLQGALASRPALIIDGLFGIGLNRPLDGEWVAFLEEINRSKRPVLAVDVPSGLNADTGENYGAVLRATVTLAVGAPKVGLVQPAAWPWTGRVAVTGEVGLLPCPCDADSCWVCADDFHGFPPARRCDSHKGSYGHLAILAGSRGFHGAAVLAAQGAQRARPGLVTVHTPEPVYVPVASQLRAVMVWPWSDTTAFPGPWTGFVVGPGLAAADVPPAIISTVRSLWQHAPCPVLADASALEWLPRGAVPPHAIRVLTPHPGEAARLLKTTPAQVQADRFATLRELSRAFGGAWVVLKGHQTLIGHSSGPVFVNSSGNPDLAQGGSGDVLAGYLGGLLAQPASQVDPLTTLLYGVWQHGATADDLDRTQPNWCVEDLAAHLGAALPHPAYRP